MLIIFIAYFFLATAISANKVLLGFLPPSFFVGIRMLTAGLIMITYNYFKSNRMRFSYFKKDLPKIISIALLTTLIPSILKAYGLKHIFSSKAALMGSLDPFITAIYAYILFSEKLTWKKLLGIMVGFLGISLLVIAKSPIEEPLLAWFEISYPEIALLGATAIGRYGWILIRSLLKKERYQPTEINGLTMFISGTLALIMSYFIDPISSIYIPSIPKFLGLFVYTILAGNILGYALFAKSFTKYQITFVSLAGFSIPVFVTIIGWTILGEPISSTFLLSTLIIFAGLLLFHFDGLKKAIYKS